MIDINSALRDMVRAIVREELSALRPAEVPKKSDPVMVAVGALLGSREMTAAQILDAATVDLRAACARQWPDAAPALPSARRLGQYIGYRAEACGIVGRHAENGTRWRLSMA